jgi:hypothetical protein
MVSRRLSATGIRFSAILFPPRSWALLTVGLPNLGPDPDGVTAFRTHELRPGRAPSTPRGQRCSPGLDGLPSRRLPHSQRPVLAPHPARPIGRGPLHEASTRVQAIRPSGLPLARGRPDGTGRRFGFPPSFAPRRPRAGRRTPGWGQAIEHGPGTTRSTHIRVDPPNR